MSRELVVLLSRGAHPASLRARVPDAEGRALGLARAGAHSVTALHAGPAALAAALRPCLGMGADRLVVLGMPSDSDPLPALAHWLAAAHPDLVLTGDRAETGEGSGLSPFWLAERLGWPLVSSAVALEWVGPALQVTQALARGRRRVLEAPTPVVVTVGRAAPAAPLSALGRASRETVRHEAGHLVLPDAGGNWSRRPARARPRALAAPGAASGTIAATRQEMIAPDPTEAADAILDLLERESLIAFCPRDTLGPERH